MGKTYVALAILLAFLTTGACGPPGEAPSGVSPVATPVSKHTEFLSPLPEHYTRTYLPVVANRAGIDCFSNKKGVSVGVVDPIPGLGCSSWYYGRHDHKVDGIEFVYYFDVPRLLERVLDERLPITGKYVMALNECDGDVFDCPSLEDQVRLIIRLEEYLDDDQVIVGPCPSSVFSALQYLQGFWTIYTQLTGRSPDPERFRNCFHCYGDFVPCSWLVDTLADEMELYGLRTSWVTEWSTLPGMVRSYDKVLEENTKFLCWMEKQERIERYAYWSAGWSYYGWHIPGRPGEAWVPLYFLWQERDWSLTWKPTAAGEWWATMPGRCDEPTD